MTEKLSERMNRDDSISAVEYVEAVEALEAERDTLKEQLKYALGDSSVEGEPRHYPFCDTCGRICHEITLPNTFIEEYTCHYCCERRDFESQVKQLIEENIGLRELNNGLNYCAEQSDLKRKEADSQLAKAQAHLKMTIDSLEDGRPQVTHSYYVACIRVRLGDLAFILKGVKAQTQSDEALEGSSPSALKGEDNEND